MNQNNNRIVYRDGRKWINHRIDGRGPDTSHHKLNLAIQRATRSIQKHGDGQLKVIDENNDTIVYQVCDEDTIYETANDEPEIELWQCEQPYSWRQKEILNWILQKCLKKSFEVILESTHILNCDTDASSE